MPKKVRETLKAMSIPIQGPVWHLITRACHVAVAKALDISPEIKRLIPLINLREAKNWSTIGLKTLSQI